MDLIRRGRMTRLIVLTIGYDRESLEDPLLAWAYQGRVERDFHGRLVPPGAHGSFPLEEAVSSARLLGEAAVLLFDRITDPALLIRRITIAAAHLEKEEEVLIQNVLELDDAWGGWERRQRIRERQLQRISLEIQRKFGSHALFKALSLREEATALERSRQIGGHRA